MQLKNLQGYFYGVATLLFSRHLLIRRPARQEYHAYRPQNMRRDACGLDETPSDRILDLGITMTKA
jgi:hypothetical protein